MNIITIPMLSPQNFPIPAGYSQLITFIVNPAITSSLFDTNIFWRVYSQWQGIPNRDEMIFEKSTLPSPPPDIVPIDSPTLSFTVQVHTADTVDLLGNYYHEASIQSAGLEIIGGSWGIMAVTATENRL